MLAFSNYSSYRNIIGPIRFIYFIKRRSIRKNIQDLPAFGLIRCHVRIKNEKRRY